MNKLKDEHGEQLLEKEKLQRKMEEERDNDKHTIDKLKNENSSLSDRLKILDDTKLQRDSLLE
jgi:hypothetical protein